MTGGEGEYTYKWTINGQSPASGETYEVPSTAKFGDEIKVTVTDSEGNTASDTVYVGGLTILSVEPTTAATGDVGYKYVRVTFSKALDSLDSSEITIRHAKSNQLFSIESVKLSSDGTFADVVLYGSYDSDGTTFLKANQPYICTLTKNGETASLGFEIPGFVSDAYVWAVDVDKNTIKIGNSGRKNQNNADNVTVAYTLPSSYEGNLGTLVGNTVSFYYDADYNISDFEVQDQEVVIGALKYNVPSGSAGVYDFDKNYFSQGDNKYYLKATASASSNPTHVYSIYNGDWVELVKNHVYQYAKLVLNPDGTVAQAALLPAWTNMIFATSIDKKVVTESKSKSKDFDGFTIVKDDAYVTTADIEEGDVIYWYSDEDAGVKFAEIYNDEVTGELTKTYSKTAILDGTSYTYRWDDPYAGRIVGQYVKDGKYTNLDEKVLVDYEKEEAVTFTLNRLGNVVKAEGTTGEEVSNTTEYMLTANAVGYKAAGTSYLKFKVSDGTTKSTITVPIDDLKKINGVTLAKLATPATTDAGKNNKIYLNNTDDQDDQAELTANYNSGTAAAPVITTFIGKDNVDGTTLDAIFPAGTLLKVTTDEDGAVIGVATSVSQNDLTLETEGTSTEGDVEAAATMCPVLPNGQAQAFKPGLTTIYTDDGAGAPDAKLSIAGDAEVWVAKSDFSTVKKMNYADFTGASLAGEEANVLIVPSGTKVKQVVILESEDTLGDDEVAEKEWGVVTESLVGYVDDDHTNALKKLTVLNPDGEKVVYEDIDSDLGGQDVGSIVYVESDSSGKVIKINDAAGDMLADGVYVISEAPLDKAETLMSDGTSDFDNNATLKDDTNNAWVVEAADGALVAKFDGTKVTTTTISAINNEESMSGYNYFSYGAVRVNGDDVEASIIVAIKDSATAAAATEKAAIEGLADPVALTATTSTAALQKFDLVTGFTGINMATADYEVTSEDFTVGTLTYNGTTSTLVTTGASAGEKATITVTTALGNSFDIELTTAPAALDLTHLPATGIVVTTTASGTKTTNADAFAFVDQYGDPIAIATITGQSLAPEAGNTGNATGKLSVTSTGIANITMTDGTTAGDQVLTYTDTTNGLKWTVSGTADTSGTVSGVEWTIAVAAVH